MKCRNYRERKDNFHFGRYGFFFFFLFLPCLVACGILVPWAGIKSRPPAVEAQSPNHWTARELLIWNFFEIKFLKLLA